MGQMQILVQQTLNENPYYENLASEFAGKKIEYTPSVLNTLIKDELSFANKNGGNLAIPGQPGGVWADYTRFRWLESVQLYGDDSNFAKYHGPKLTTLLEQDYVKHIKPPVMPVVPINPVVPVVPVPPVHPVCPIVPVCPVPPVCPINSIPEPSSAALGMLSITLVFVATRLRHRLFG